MGLNKKMVCDEKVTVNSEEEKKNLRDVKCVFHLGIKKQYCNDSIYVRG